ncbi:RNA ligase family protein [Brevibacillus centrosporus]|uniref:ATP-dependent DNA ligase n=1 Tax=Brevibacillus centrosporus TaxID=54910 RepID=UPI002E220F4B|nr:RNA ligase family protein [Brevibacillus centrosporus]
MQQSLIHHPLPPMLLTQSETPPTGNYLAQVKFDGHRCIFSYNGNDVRLFTRELNDCTQQYPEAQFRMPVRNVVLDGEMIAFDEKGKPCFDSLMTRFHCSKDSTIRSYMKSIPSHYVAFDLLYLNDEDYTKRPIEDRLEALESIVEPSNAISVCPTFDDGQKLFQSVAAQGMEGIVSKRRGSPIELGTRSKNWIKTKAWNYEEVEISAIRKGKFGWSLTLNGRYVGVTEFVPPKERKAFFPIALQLKTHEDPNWIYLQPLIRCKVKFQCYSKKGHMRSPSFVSFVGL